jgi:hypothetical protein
MKIQVGLASKRSSRGLASLIGPLSTPGRPAGRRDTIHRPVDEILQAAGGAIDDQRTYRFFKRLWEYDQIVFETRCSSRF